MVDHRSVITSDPCAVSSVVEHYLDTVGVRGSNPLPRTIFFRRGSRMRCLQTDRLSTTESESCDNENSSPQPGFVMGWSPRRSCRVLPCHCPSPKPRPQCVLIFRRSFCARQ